MASPDDIDQVFNLLSQLGIFDFILGIFTPEKYGRHVIMNSDYYEIDENLENRIDFKEYGEQSIAGECGRFTKFKN